MRAAVFFMALVLNSAWALDSSVFGTHWVKFQPTTNEGVLTGCSLTYLAVQADRVYKNGEPVIVNGGIWLASTEKNIGLMLKVGLKSANDSASKFERPNFAYLQGVDKNTSQSTISVSDGEDGYKLFVYSLNDPTVRSVFSDLVSGSKIAIMFNRQKSGMDVSVPLDVFVVDSQYTKDSKVERKVSKDVITQFSDCTLKLADELRAKFSVSK